MSQQNGPEGWRNVQRTASQYNFPWGWVFRVIGIVVLLVVVIGALNFVFAWVGAGRDVASPENVQAQWRFAYDTIEDLEAIARNVCNAETALQESNNANADSNTVEQRRSHLLAFQNNYERVANDYDGQVRDAFRGGLVKPPDVPERAPSLKANKLVVCSQ
ncbi:MAG TPA: hypothetical protein VFE94_02030 [Candidatus Paceibacterota bacterium]|nr:hypothetical protein [Candidatus Paceibacterota bacterium]